MIIIIIAEVNIPVTILLLRNIADSSQTCNSIAHSQYLVVSHKFKIYISIFPDQYRLISYLNY